MKIDESELLNACVLLYLDLPVRVEFCEVTAAAGGGSVRRCAQYVGVDDDGHHIIEMDPEIIPLAEKPANWFFWHELGHCMQAERHARTAPDEDFFVLYQRTMVQAGIVDPDLHANVGEVELDEEAMSAYRCTPFELEADLVASRYAHDHVVVIDT